MQPQTPVSQTLVTLTDIKTRVDQLATHIGAAGNLLPTFGRNEYDAHPHIEVDSRGYHYVVVERGREIERFCTTRLDDLLFRIFQDVAFVLAMQYESAHRVPGQDPRRVLFAHQVELLSRLSPVWAEREALRQQQTLEQHPYDDAASVRADLAQSLRHQGYAAETAWKLACERYPRPPAAAG
jgi:hypothetical protein